MPEVAQNREIRVAPCPTCILCGTDGVLIYAGQKDRLFGAGGLWDFKKCSNRTCGLIWLDPMPVIGDLEKAYVNYYTHAERSGANRPGLLKRIYQLMRRGYWAGEYKYPIADSTCARRVGKLLYLFPVRRSGADGEVKFLHAVPQGRLLDVGCGSGDWLLFMRALGWQVEGVDFDRRAVEVATQRWLKVRCGTLEQQSFPSATFDAVTLNHVIEHVPDPLGTFMECARILQSGGKLVVCTPNSSSVGHRLFKAQWRGLEPPRHLHLFSMQSLSRILKQVGFQEISIHPQIVRSVIYESFLLALGQTHFSSASSRNWIAEGLTRLFIPLELPLVMWDRSASDCVAVVAVK